MLRVLLCEPDAVLAHVLSDVFADERLEVIPCTSLDAIEAALARYPDAIVVTDSWSDCRHAALRPCEQDQLRRLGQRAPVIVTTAHAWARQVATLGLGESIVVIPKPYDLDALLEAVRGAFGRALPSGQPGAP